MSINQNNFEEVLAKHDLALQIAVPDRLRDNAEGDIPVHLAFRGMKDFEPAGIAEQVPEMRKLLRLRDAFGLPEGAHG